MFIRSLKLKNILSFREPPQLELGPLNILIGPNGSGKSNVIACVELLQSLPNSISNYLNTWGGASAWLWKGSARGPTARIQCELVVESADGEKDSENVQYLIEFTSLRHALGISTEWLGDQAGAAFLERFDRSLKISTAAEESSISAAASALEVYRNPSDPTPITRTARALNEIRFYKEFRTGMEADTRMGIASSGPKSPLASTGGNLALVMQEMDFQGSVHKLKDYLRRLSPRFEDIKTRAEGGRSQLYLQERGLGMIPATHLSDGTLKFLCLMAVLLDPSPGPLVCIEEPEIGLHPEALALVGDALREASQRTQLLVTTHSDALVDCFTDEPESIIVCERDLDESTCFRRLSTEQLKEWLEDYTLGDLWRRGEIGGTQR
ncbi:MAG: AAA family ATPase [Acidobacteriia bacterium]|nr:AAA family ATPase [Terriglobia bacterium]